MPRGETGERWNGRGRGRTGAFREKRRKSFISFGLAPATDGSGGHGNTRRGRTCVSARKKRVIAKDSWGGFRGFMITGGHMGPPLQVYRELGASGRSNSLPYIRAGMNCADEVWRSEIAALRQRNLPLRGKRNCTDGVGAAKFALRASEIAPLCGAIMNKL